MKNIEIKVRVDKRTEMLRAIRSLGAEKVGVLRQADTYFSVPKGRLKLREEKSSDHAELICYSRPDTGASRVSEYGIQTIPKEVSRGFKAFLEKALPVLVVVKKRRGLYLCKHTRIHLDQVDGLGDFLELETVISKQTLSQAKKEHREVIQKLGLNRCEKIPVSYSDLLLNMR